jgi:hypothetical protein
MKFMVEFRFQPGKKDQAVAAFEQRGPNRYPGVSLRDAWIGTKTDAVFALVESENESHVAAAGKFWQQFGELTIHPVIDVQQY